MPTYDYQCDECGHEFETVHKMTDELTICPKCGEPKLKKVIKTAPGFELRGDGYYRKGKE